MKKHFGNLLADDLAQMEDHHLVVECLAGNSSAWEALLARYQRLIYSIPIKSGLGPADADDIFQSVCLKLYEKLGTLRDHQRIASWLITTTTRECWRSSARSRRESLPALRHDEEEGDPVKELADTRLLASEEQEMIEQQQLLREAIDALPERSRRLIQLLYYEKDELSYAEIARLMSMPVASIGPTRARALEKLKKILEERSAPRSTARAQAAKPRRKPNHLRLASTTKR